jgi:broad specificity phosphatase PhoE
MTKVILVRHGQTAWNREERFRGHAEVPLDEIGLAQAKATAARISAQWKPDAIYAGPLSRTVKTAEPAAQLFNLDVQIEPDLIDADCGDWQGFSPGEVNKRWPAEFHSYLHTPRDFQFPGGESLEQARRRAMNCVNILIEHHPDQIIVLVSHTALNRLILLSVLGLDSHSFWSIRQDTCAINVFESEENQLTLITLNETGHLLSVNANKPTTESKTI